MGVPKIIYTENSDKKNSWVKYILNRIRKNENFLCCINGPTGIGKTYTGISLGDMISKETNKEFNIHYIPFTFVELMRLINSDRLKKGSVIVFDEPQVAIGSKDHQSSINKAFHNLASTFRHKNYIMFFCNPFLEDLDKSVRKLFHAQFQITSKDEKSKEVSIKPYYLQWNPQKDKFYKHFLKIVSKDPGKSKPSIKPLKVWKIPHPPKELIQEYENKKTEFTNALNLKIQQKLEEAEFNVKDKQINEQFDFSKRLTKKQVDALFLYRQHKTLAKVAKILKKTVPSVHTSIQGARRKGFTEDNIEVYMKKFGIHHPMPIYE